MSWRDDFALACSNAAYEGAKQSELEQALLTELDIRDWAKEDNE